MMQLQFWVGDPLHDELAEEASVGQTLVREFHPGLELQ